MKRTTAPVLLMALALCLSSCTDEVDPEGWQPGEGPAPSPTEKETEDGTYVFNRYQDEQGYRDESPEVYVATQFTSFSDMSWDEWSDEIARGSGNMAGSWCLNLDCDEDPYQVDVELGDPVEVDGVSYFSTYEVTDAGDMPEDVRQGMEAADEGRLTLPRESGGTEAPDDSSRTPDEESSPEDENGGD
ncbi:hypothetical protein [Nocardiopsis kunsanensis]|uniref:Lipoprotein n=1 Tax=Nocardiopsis kunsanensis TaxID=141693 RepID=A0A919CGT3_9ACTN|nr:hypothetical protein [Nocardiopsis kunsanensis]GHD23439.1 hypothetical protein GCM10007147_18700 [Nocardiopsis kunsanensis]